MNGLFVFRRDLRLSDNTGLIELCKICKNVYCIFVLDDRQVNPKKNEYFTYAGMRFMLQSLKELRGQIDVIVEYGKLIQILYKIIKELEIGVVYANADYTPFALRRDKEMAELCSKMGVKVEFVADCYINSPDAIKPYKVFTPYYNIAKSIRVRGVESMSRNLIGKIRKVRNKEIDLDELIINCEKHMEKMGYQIDLVQNGGRKEGIRLLKKFVNERGGRYDKHRDLFMFETSRLSPHIKFGTLSIREVYWTCKSATYRKELYWRDFYMQVGFNFPHVFGHNFRDVGLKWKYDKISFVKWCEGKTGIDIIDACMTQLNRTGFMHNRGRMIVANYLTSKLGIDWRLGEKYFASRLTDYDPCSNNGGWQWASGTGADANPVFRVFNPELQAKRFDPDGEYRKRWLA